MAPLLKPHETTVLVLDLDKIECAPDARTINNVLLTIRAAKLVGAPTFLTVNPCATSATIKIASEFASLPILPLDVTAAPWTTVDLGKALSAATRQCLLIVGGTLGINATFAALKALSEGYDVYALIDAMICGAPEDRALALLRLSHVGAVSLTTLQFIHEWAASAQTVQQREALLDLWCRQNRT